MSAGEGELARAIASKSEQLQTSRGQRHEREWVQQPMLLDFYIDTGPCQLTTLDQEW